MADSNGYSSVFLRQAGTGSAAILKDKPNETLDLLMKRKWQKEDLDNSARAAAAVAEAKRIADLKQPTMTSNNLRKPFIEQNNANQQYGQDILLENITKGTDANKDPRFFQYQAEKNRLEQENKQYETATQPFNDGQGLGMRDENGNYYEYTSLNELENTGGYSPKNEYYKRQNSDTFGKTISDRPQAAVNDGTSSINAPMYGNFGKDMVAQTQNNQEFARYLQDGLGVNVQSFEKDQQFLKLDKGKSLSSGGTAHTQTPTYSIDKEALTKNVGERLLGDMNGIAELSKNATFAPMVNNYYKYKEEGDKVNADKELKKIYNTKTFTDYANTAVDMEMQRIGKTQKAMNELASYSFSKQNVATGFNPNAALDRAKKAEDLKGAKLDNEKKAEDAEEIESGGRVDIQGGVAQTTGNVRQDIYSVPLTFKSKNESATSTVGASNITDLNTGKKISGGGVVTMKNAGYGMVPSFVLFDENGNKSVSPMDATNLKRNIEANPWNTIYTLGSLGTIESTDPNDDTKKIEIPVAVYANRGTRAAKSTGVIDYNKQMQATLSDKGLTDIERVGMYYSIRYNMELDAYIASGKKDAAKIFLNEEYKRNLYEESKKQIIED